MNISPCAKKNGEGFIVSFEKIDIETTESILTPGAAVVFVDTEMPVRIYYNNLVVHEPVGSFQMPIQTVKHSCKPHDYQDKTYGSNKRVYTTCDKGMRCTVCGTVESK